MRERRYAIVGATVRELERALERFGPRRAGRVFAAHTDWEISWSLDGPAAPAVYLSASVVLPRWIPARDAPAPLRAEWDRYVAALAAHEALHLDVARRAAARLEAALLAPDVDAPQAERVAAAVQRDARAEEVELDRRTQHGRGDGAVLRAPPEAG